MDNFNLNACIVFNESGHICTLLFRLSELILNVFDSTADYKQFLQNKSTEQVTYFSNFLLFFNLSMLIQNTAKSLT